ncbi:hypothetical protein [Mucilaginibacter agri]|uniref:DUF4142 domain-containing protein n=1 Tax=Mucilaginibacter agri TaxID=2695265 RepID=A0A965ZHF6_9SPHI|nr:hypothetical protein [Mucilaginibacter agri]NCD70775.1 hypothetical protein [Mucilaginibacter agri]
MPLLIGTLLMVCSGAMAQTAAVTKIATVMTDSLGYLHLTDQQKTSALALNKTAATSLIATGKKAKADTSFRGKALAKEVVGIMKQRNAGLKPLLTPDQQKLFQEHRMAQIVDLQTKVMTAQLSLTDAQVPQVYAINQKATAEMMSDMGKMKQANRKMAKMKAGKALKSDSKDKSEALKKVLTPDQYAIYEKHQEEMKAAIKEKMQEKKAQKG